MTWRLAKGQHASSGHHKGKCQLAQQDRILSEKYSQAAQTPRYFLRISCFLASSPLTMLFLVEPLPATPATARYRSTALPRVSSFRPASRSADRTRPFTASVIPPYRTATRGYMSSTKLSGTFHKYRYQVPGYTGHCHNGPLLLLCLQFIA